MVILREMSLFAARGHGTLRLGARMCFSLVPLSFVCLLHAACGPAPVIAMHSAIELPLTGVCPTDGSGGSEYVAEALKVTIAAPDMKKNVEATGDSGTLSIDAIPAGKNRVVGAFGLNNGVVTWRGVARGVTVKEGEDTAVDVLMTKLADITCARNVDTNARAFHTATVLRDGRVLLVGGAETSSVETSCGGCTVFHAGTSATVFSPQTGTLSPSGVLHTPRMFHTAVLMDDGRVVVAGGASELAFHPGDVANYPFPLAPTNGAVVAEIEVWDPKTGEFSVVGPDPAGGRVFAAGTATPSGDALVTGGVPAAASPNNLGNALTSTTLCSGKPLVCTSGPVMARPRAGHVAFRIEPDGVFLLGGSVDTTAVADRPGYQMERFTEGVAFTLLDVPGMTVARNVFFAASVQYVPFRVLVAGGLVRDAVGAFSLTSVSLDGVAHAPVILFDATAGSEGGIVVQPTGVTAPMHLAGVRFGASGGAFPDQQRALFAGGFTDLALTPSDGVDLFDEAELVVRSISVGGQPRTLRQPRGGSVAVGLSDGNIIFTGGFANPAASPATTVEIYADTETPPGVAP